jgi:hypothetical protein
VHGATAVFRKFSFCMARTRRAGTGLTFYPPFREVVTASARRDHRKSKFGLRYHIKLIELHSLVHSSLDYQLWACANLTFLNLCQYPGTDVHQYSSTAIPAPVTRDVVIYPYVRSGCHRRGASGL